MYILQQKSKEKDSRTYDYVFKSFKLFYTIADLMTYKLNGRYCICIETEDVEGVAEFIGKAEQYSALDVYIYVPEQVLEKLQLNYPNAVFGKSVKMIEVFKELVSKYGVLFDKGVMYTLYNSIPHEISDMDAALRLIVQTYNVESETITEKMLSKLFVLNKTVYPRTVLLSFLNMDRYRWSKLNKSVETIGNDIVFFAMRKNLKTFMEEKASYFKTGSAKPLIKSIDTRNLCLMYRCLYLENAGIQDVSLIMQLYEKGESVYDSLYRNQEIEG